MNEALILLLVLGMLSPVIWLVVKAARSSKDYDSQI